MPTATNLCDLLRAAGEPTRLRILNLLTQGGLCVCEIQAVLGIPQSTVSRHLAGLRSCGLVIGKRVGPRAFYALAPDAELRSFFEFLRKGCSEARPLRDDLRRLGRLLSKRPGDANPAGSASPTRLPPGQLQG